MQMPTCGARSDPDSSAESLQRPRSDVEAGRERDRLRKRRQRARLKCVAACFVTATILSENAFWATWAIFGQLGKFLGHPILRIFGQLALMPLPCLLLAHVIRRPVRVVRSSEAKRKRNAANYQARKARRVRGRFVVNRRLMRPCLAWSGPAQKSSRVLVCPAVGSAQAAESAKSAFRSRSVSKRVSGCSCPHCAQ